MLSLFVEQIHFLELEPVILIQKLELWQYIEYALVAQQVTPILIGLILTRYFSFLPKNNGLGPLIPE
jgi:hypothetical protein